MKLLLPKWSKIVVDLVMDLLTLQNAWFISTILFWLSMHLLDFLCIALLDHLGKNSWKSCLKTADEEKVLQIQYKYIRTVSFQCLLSTLQNQIEIAYGLFGQYGNTGCRVFKWGVTKLERFLPKNQHTQRKIVNFENWIIGGIRSFKTSEFLNHIV